MYEQARSEALTDPGPAPADWEPDAVLGLSWPLATTLLSAEVEQHMAGKATGVEVDLPLGMKASLTPELSYKDAELTASSACDSCVDLKARFKGRLAWSVGYFDGHVPLSMRAELCLELQSSTGETTQVEAALREATIRLPDIPEIKRVDIDLDNPLAEWALGRMKTDFPRIPVAELKSEKTDTRALRVKTSADYLQIEILTSSPIREQPPASAEAGHDWVLSVSQTALLGLARRAAFEEGELAYEVYADPQGLEVEGDRFTLQLRLWRLKGSGWWRDYQVSGALAVEGERLHLDPQDVAEADHSRGAALVDPLAVLAKGAIIAAIEDGLTVARPATMRESVGGSRVTLSAEQAQGSEGSLHLMGAASVAEKKSKKSTTTKKKKKKKKKKTKGR